MGDGVRKKKHEISREGGGCSKISRVLITVPNLDIPIFFILDGL